MVEVEEKSEIKNENLGDESTKATGTSSGKNV